jgi:nicotinic acid mononucleotide adenylyltransferase
MSSENLIDFAKVIKNLENAMSDKAPSKQQFWILVMNGSYNPVHVDHIRIMNAVKGHIEGKNLAVVVGAFLSTSADQYVAKKLGHQALIPNSHRYKMIQLAAKDSSFIDACGYGIASPRQTNAKLCAQFMEIVKTNVHTSSVSEDQIRVVEVNGADTVARSQSKKKKFHGHNSVVVGRAGSDVKAICRESPDIIFVECDFGASSTRVRNGEHGLLDESVRSYMEEMGLFKHTFMKGRKVC